MVRAFPSSRAVGSLWLSVCSSGGLTRYTLPGPAVAGHVHCCSPSPGRKSRSCSARQHWTSPRCSVARGLWWGWQGDVLASRAFFSDFLPRKPWKSPSMQGAHSGSCTSLLVPRVRAVWTRPSFGLKGRGKGCGGMSTSFIHRDGKGTGGDELSAGRNSPATAE